MVGIFCSQARADGEGLVEGYLPDQYRTISATRCRVRKEAPGSPQFYECLNSKLLYRVKVKEGHSVVDLNLIASSQGPDEKGQHLRYKTTRPPLWIREVFSARLNEDAIDDYVISFYSTGCGLAGELVHLLVVLSNDSGSSEVMSFYTMGFSNNRLVRLPDNRSAIICTAYVAVETKRDKKYHSFWRHTSLRVSGSSLYEDSGFGAVWVQYTNRPQNQPTKLLTATEQLNYWQQFGEEANECKVVNHGTAK